MAGFCKTCNALVTELNPDKLCGKCRDSLPDDDEEDEVQYCSKYPKDAVIPDDDFNCSLCGSELALDGHCTGDISVKPPYTPTVSELLELIYTMLDEQEAPNGYIVDELNVKPELETYLLDKYNLSRTF